MEQSNVYEEQYEEGITFKKVGYFFKKGWLRIVIYMAIAALLTTAIAVPIKVFYKSEPVATTSVEFIFDGIESGVAPDGSIFDHDMMISTTVLSGAVTRSSLGGVVTDISKLREHMRVEGVLTDEYVKLTEAAANGDSAAAEKLRNYNMFPTRFDIVISEPEELGLNDGQAKILLDNVLVEYYNVFKRYLKLDDIPHADDAYILTDSSKEFTAIHDEYVGKLNDIRTYINSFAVKHPAIKTYSETKYTNVIGSLTRLLNDYAEFNAYLLSDNIWRNADTARGYLTSTQISINNNLKAENEYKQNLEAQIKNIVDANRPTIDTIAGGQVIVNYPSLPAAYNDLNAKLDDTNGKIRDYSTQLANIAMRLDGLTNSEPADAETMANAETRIKDLEKRTERVAHEVKALVEDYYDTSSVSLSVRQVQPPVVTRRSLDFNLLLIYVVALIAGLLIGSLVTAIKIARAKDAKTQDDQVTSETENN